MEHTPRRSFSTLALALRFSDAGRDGGGSLDGDLFIKITARYRGSWQVSVNVRASREPWMA